MILDLRSRERAIDPGRGARPSGVRSERNGGAMKQRWWIAIVAVLGIGLAVLLFPRPDTGQDLPPAGEANPANTDPLAFRGDDGPRNGAPAAKTGKRQPGTPGGMRTGPKPGTSALQERRNRTEVVYASKLVTPFSAVRYTLLRKTDDAA